jgi:hypothetical protein
VSDDRRPATESPGPLRAEFPEPDLFETGTQSCFFLKLSVPFLSSLTSCRLRAHLCQVKHKSLTQLLVISKEIFDVLHESVDA